MITKVLDLLRIGINVFSFVNDFFLSTTISVFSFSFVLGVGFGGPGYKGNP
jgi:hypothetical protein